MDSRPPAKRRAKGPEAPKVKRQGSGAEPTDIEAAGELAHLAAGRLRSQIAALREVAAVHSPGTESTQLRWRQTRELAELLQRHRDELRALLNGDGITQDDQAAEVPEES